jgi:hypothetical protein
VSRMTDEPIIGISITAADLTRTAQPPAVDHHHQYRIGSTTFIYFTPATAKQWIAELTTITEGNN